MDDRRYLDELTDEQWARLAPFMGGGCKGKRGPKTDNRLFMNAVLWTPQSSGFINMQQGRRRKKKA